MSTRGDVIVNKSKHPWSFQIQKNFVIDTRLTRDARMLFIIIKSFASEERPVPFPGVSLLCRLMGCTEDTFRKYRHELEEQEWLRVQHVRGDRSRFERNEYHLLDGPDSPSPKKPGTEKCRDREMPSRRNPGTKSTQYLKSVPNHEVETREERRAPGGASRRSEILPSAEGEGKLAAPTLERRTDTLLSAWKSWYKQYYQRDLILDANQKKKVSTFLKDNPEVQVKTLMGYALYVWWYAETTVLAKNLEKFNWHCVNKSALPGDFVSNFTKINEDCDVSYDEMTPDRVAKANRKMVKLIEERKSNPSS